MANAKILIVEDEILIARKIEASLKQAGYQVTGIATDATLAFKQIAQICPDLVLMDIVIPGELDGIEAASQIRDRFRIPVVYLTAYADENTVKRANLTQPFGYILKPFNSQQLCIAIELALSRHQTETAVNQALAACESCTNGTPSAGSPSDYLSMMSHEFRTPLSIIKLSAALLSECSDRLSDAKKQEHLQRIQYATNSMNELLEDVLFFGKTSASKTSFLPGQLNVTQFCQELLETLRWSVDEQHQIVFNQPPLPILAQLDEKLLWHLLNNLLSNAIKYSPAGGTITLTLRETDDRIKFMVADQGVGIPPADQASLFEPFHRARNVGQIPGTGLGLAIVQKCTELHSGTIDFTSQLGVGTTFVVQLPKR